MIEVSMGIILNSERKILIARRPLEKNFGGLWEFPGGKIEEGESPEEALQRELKEELNVEVEVTEGLPPYHYSDNSLEIEFHPFICHCKRDPFELNEHTEALYIGREEFGNYSFAPPDYTVLEYLKGPSFDTL
jgi:mutator protein MutT